MEDAFVKKTPSSAARVLVLLQDKRPIHFKATKMTNFPLRASTSTELRNSYIRSSPK